RLASPALQKMRATTQIAYCEGPFASLALRQLNSHRRQHLVPAIIGVEFSAALPSDRGAARGGGGVGGHAERAAQAVGALAHLAGGKCRAGGGDAEHQKCGGDDLDR